MKRKKFEKKNLNEKINYNILNFEDNKFWSCLYKVRAGDPDQISFIRPSKDPDPQQNDMDPKPWFFVSKISFVKLQAFFLKKIGQNIPQILEKTKLGFK